jgi:hypothetical protein
MRPDELERRARARVDAFPPAARAELLHVLRVLVVVIVVLDTLVPARAGTETTVWEGRRLLVTTEPPARVLRIDLYNKTEHRLIRVRCEFNYTRPDGTTGHWTFHRWIQPDSKTYKPLHDRVATNEDGSAATFNWDCRVIRALRT